MKIRLSDPMAIRLAKLHPQIKRAIRNGLDDILDDPEIGKPLQDELIGWRSHRVHKYRIIYRVRDNDTEVAELGPRTTIYQDMLRIIKTGR